MSSPALVRLSALLEAQGLSAPSGLPTRDTPPPPSQRVAALEALAERIAHAQVQAQARLSQAQERVRALAAMPPERVEALASLSALSPVKVASLALEELDRATNHHQALVQAERRRQAALLAALEERAEAVARFRAAWKRRHAGPPLAAGMSQSIGPAVEDALHAAIDQLLDRVIAAEQATGADHWQHKDRLDLAREQSTGMARMGPREGLALISETVQTLEQISAAVSGPGRQQSHGQEDHDKAAQ